MNKTAQRLLLTIFLYKWYVISFFIITLATVTYSSLTAPFIYEGHGSLLVIRPGTPPKFSPFTIDTTTSAPTNLREQIRPEDVLSEMELVRSRPVIEKTVDETHLDDLSKLVFPDGETLPQEPEPTGLKKWVQSLQESVKDWMVTTGLSVKMDKREGTILYLQSQIQVRPIRDSNLFSISFVTKDPRISAYVVNTVIKYYLEYRREVYRPQAELSYLTEKQQIYERELSEKKQQLDELIQQQHDTGQKSDDAKLDDLRSAIVYTAKLKEDYQDKLQEMESNYSLYLANILEVRTVEQAAPSWKPVGPKRLANILLAIPLGLFGGILIALIRENLGSAFHSAEEAATKLDTTVLATIPEIRQNKNTERDVDASCYYVHSRLQAMQTKPGIPVVVFTSGVRGAGVTTVSRYYALFAARYLKLRTLLVDANLQNPSQHALAKIPASPGFLDVITKRKTLKESIISTGIENLSILPAGTALDIIPTPEQLLLWRAQAREEFQLIIIDSPPASAGLSLYLCTIATAVIFITRLHFGDSQTILNAYKALRESNAPLVGLLANRKLL